MRKIKRFIKRNCLSILLIISFSINIFSMFIFIDTIIQMIELLENNILFIATILLVIVTCLYYFTSRKTMWYQALLDAKKDYRSPEMMTALHILWNLYNEKCGKDVDCFVREYLNIVEEEDKKILQENYYKAKFNLIKGSLSYQRRLVLTFYFYLYDLYKHKILSEEMVFGYWHKNNLEIIPKILIPIHMAQVKLDTSDEEIAQKRLDKLQELYDESKQYQKDIDC